jgi:hypothetical protein
LALGILTALLANGASSAPPLQPGEIIVTLLKGGVSKKGSHFHERSS